MTIVFQGHVTKIEQGHQGAGGAYSAPDTRNWRQRLLSRLFPAQLVAFPDDADGFAPGYMRTEVHIRLDLLDRLRTMVSGQLQVVVVSQTNVNVEKVRSISTVWVKVPNA